MLITLIGIRDLNLPIQRRIMLVIQTQKQRKFYSNGKQIFRCSYLIKRIIHIPHFKDNTHTYLSQVLVYHHLIKTKANFGRNRQNKPVVFDITSVPLFSTIANAFKQFATNAKNWRYCILAHQWLRHLLWKPEMDLRNVQKTWKQCEIGTNLMNKHVLFGIIPVDETVSAFHVKPLDSTRNLACCKRKHM